ncbi:MAG: hypothetical protein AAFR12_05300 [Cyanobacteria bacterium J06626_6]
MNVPPPSPAEHLQSTLRRFYNREIRDWFDDIDLDDLDINVPRQSLAMACRHLDEDSAMMTLQRMMLFNDMRGRYALTVQGVGETTFKESVRRRKRPKITLYFIEDFNDVAEGYAPVDGQISVRLMDHDQGSITEAIARTFATRIKTAFAAGSGFVWKKGKVMATYTDWEKGYQLQLLCRNESEGRRVVEQVLDIQNDTPEWSYFNVKENAEPSQAFPTVPPTDRAYGKVRRQPRRRPIADVRFQTAFLHVIGVPAPVILVDRSGTYPAPLVT